MTCCSARAAPDEEGDDEDQANGGSSESDEDAEQRQSERHGRVRTAQEAETIPSVGEDTGGKADEKQGSHAKSEGESDQDAASS